MSHVYFDSCVHGPIPNGEAPVPRLRVLTARGMNWRYGSSLSAEMTTQIERELEMITASRRAEFRYDDDLVTVRYVRSLPVQGEATARRGDLITKDRNHEWQFRPDVGASEVDALASILAESMDLPEQEGDELRSCRRPVKELVSAPSA